MQPARNLVGTFVELTAGMQYRHYHFQCRAVFFGVHVNRNSAAVVLHNDGVILADGYFNVRTIAGQSLVN